MKKILAIEDDTGLQQIYKDTFSNNYELSQAMTGQEGINMIHANPPDLIILDIMLPGGDEWI